jgi:ClpP class serine protease
MKKNLQFKTGLNNIHSQLKTGVWAMSSKDFKAFKSRVELLLKEDMDDTGEDMADGDDFGDMTAPGDLAVICINGDIVYNCGMPEAMCDVVGVCDLANVYNDLLEVMANDDVKTVVLAISSPGGTTQYLQETIDLIKQVAQGKNLITYASGLFGSAAYNMGVCAEEIYVTPSCLVGSVGAAYKRYDCSQQLKDAGVKVTAIASSPKKFWGDEDTEASAEEIKWLTDNTLKLAESFKANVLAHRKIDESLLDGSVFFGTESVANNFADDLINSLDELLQTIT